MKIICSSFLFMIAFANSFLIYEKVPSQVYENKVRIELKEIANLQSLEELEYQDYEYKNESTTYSLSSVKAKAAFLNPYMPTMSISGENPLKITFTWVAEDGKINYISPYRIVYRGKISTSPSSQYEIEFAIEASKFEFTKTWEKYVQDNFYYPVGNADNIFVSFEAKCLDTKCPYSSEILLEIINAFLKENQSLMNKIFTDNGVNGYYRSLPFDKLIQKLYTQTSSSIINENNIDLCLEEAPIKDGDSFIFKRKGKLNDLEIEGDETLSDGSNNQKFYINQRVIQNLIQNNLFSIVYEQENNPSPEYELNVGYLKKIITVSENYQDSDKLRINAEMRQISFNEEESISDNLLLVVNIESIKDMENLLSFNCYFSFKFEPTLFHSGLNFVLLSKNIVLNKIESTSKLLDEELLKSWIQNTYMAALGKNEYSLLALSFDLSNYIISDNLSYEYIDNYLSIKS